MAKKCAIIPQVRNTKNGQIGDSRLFKDLLSYTDYDRASTVRIYLATKSKELASEISHLSKDENGEPTLKSIMSIQAFKGIFPDSKIISRLNKDYGFSDKDNNVIYTENTMTNFEEAERRAIEFNRGSEYSDNYIAEIVKDGKGGKLKIGVTVNGKTKANSNQSINMEVNYSLNNKLRAILASHNIGVGALNELEQRRSIGGITDFSLAKDASNGIVNLIRIAEGEKGEAALPEEFAHFAVQALGDFPLTMRVINSVASNGIASEILGEDFETYSILYNGDEFKLAEEAVGKLLAKHLNKEEEIISSSIKNLFERFVNFVKQQFSKIGKSSIQKAIIDADITLSKVAKDILTGALDTKMSVENIARTNSLYNIKDRVDRDRKILEKIVENLIKRIAIYGKRNPNSKYTVNQRLLLDSLELDMAENNFIEGIYSFLNNAFEELEKIEKRLTVLESSDVEDLNERAGILREVRNFLFSYGDILDEVTKGLVEENRFEDNRYADKIKIILDQTSLLLRDLKARYKQTALPLFIQFIKPFVGENIVVPFGRMKGKAISANELVEYADKDISFFDRWLDSMADSSDYLLKVFDQSVKKAKEYARLETIEDMKALQAAGIELEKAGVSNTEWMFERDYSGNLTGRYISEVNYSLFQDAWKKKKEELKEKYGENPSGDNYKAYRKEKEEWFSQNLETVGGSKRPRLYSSTGKPLYVNTQYLNLSEPQKKFYNTVMSIKERLDSYLPDNYTSNLNAVKIRKDLLERIKSSDDVKSGAKALWESVKDEFIRRSDDTELEIKSTLQDFEKHEVEVLPIYYTKLRKGENMNDLSTDVVSTMIAYASMANDYNEMNKIVDLLELGRNLLRDPKEGRKIIQTRGDKPMVERIEELGRTVENKFTKEGDSTRFINRLHDFFSMQVYGKYMADEGTFGKTNIDKGKVANFVNRVTSLNSLALNVLSGISNIATGTVMMRIESIAGEFFSVKDVTIADRNYGLELPAFLAEIGSRVKTNKLALWDELFNVMQEYETSIKEVNFDRKSWFSKMFGENTLFFMNNSGEHWMQNRTSLALANTMKFKDGSKEISLWDAYSPKLIGKDKSQGAYLVMKPGLKDSEGRRIVTREELKERANGGSPYNDLLLKDNEVSEYDLIRKFSRKLAGVNQRMHGIYNKLDRNAWQRLSIGRMAMMFRKWVRPSLNRRFKSATYNYDLDSWVEGYYNTSWRFLTQLASDIRNTQLNIGARWNELTKTEKANIKRAITEVTHFITIAIVLGLMEWSDDKDRPWIVRMSEYQLRRLYTELGAMVPGKSMLTEGLRILKSPAAGINTLENVLDLVNLMNPLNYMDEIQSGRYKGHSSAYRTFFNSPLVPLNRTIYRGIHPEEGIAFFEQ